MLDLSAYPLTLFAHVVAGVALLGGTLLAPLIRRLVREAGTAAELRPWLEYERLSSRWTPLAAFAVLGTGIYLGSAGWWSQGWFYVAIVAWIVNSALAAAVVHRRAAELTTSIAPLGGGPLPREIQARQWSLTWTLANGAMLANDLTILYVMFEKPNLWPTITVVLFGNVVAMAIAAARHRAALARSAQSEATRHV